MPTLERGASTSDLGGKMDGDVKMNGEELEEIEYVEEEEEEETVEEDPVIYLEAEGFQDNETIQILSDGEAEDLPGKTDKPVDKVTTGGLWDGADTRVFPPNWPEQRYFDHVPTPDRLDQKEAEQAKEAKVKEDLQEEMKSDDEKKGNETKGTFKAGFRVQCYIEFIDVFICRLHFGQLDHK